MKQYILANIKEGTGNPILFIHGLGGGGDYLHIENLPFRTTYTSIFMDLLGFGKSPKPIENIYTLTGHVKAIHTTLTSIMDANPSKKVIILGHSFGAVLALQFALDYPELVNKLILISPAVYKTTHEAKEAIGGDFLNSLILYHPTIAKHLYSNKMLYNFAHVLNHNSFSFSTAVDNILEHSWEAYYATFTQCLITHPFLQYQEIIRKFQTCIIYSDIDKLLSYLTINEMAHIANTSYCIPGVGHTLLHVKSLEVNDKIKEFLLKTNE